MSLTTKEIEKIVYRHLWKKGWYGVFECAVPRSYVNKYHRERVDFCTYETTGIWRFYEIKISKSDFYSSTSLTFLGHYNYFIMPYELYEKVEKDIPEGIGVWIVYDSKNMKCIRKPKKQELKVKHEDMLFSLMQALSREYKKYRTILEKIK